MRLVKLRLRVTGDCNCYGQTSQLPPGTRLLRLMTCHKKNQLLDSVPVNVKSKSYHNFSSYYPYWLWVLICRQILKGIVRQMTFRGTMRRNERVECNPMQYIGVLHGQIVQPNTWQKPFFEARVQNWHYKIPTFKLFCWKKIDWIIPLIEYHDVVITLILFFLLVFAYQTRYDAQQSFTKCDCPNYELLSRAYL